MLGIKIGNNGKPLLRVFLIHFLALKSIMENIALNKSKIRVVLKKHFNVLHRAGSCGYVSGALGIFIPDGSKACSKGIISSARFSGRKHIFSAGCRFGPV